MIPQILLLAYLGYGLRQAHQQRKQMPEEYQASMIQAVIILFLLYWGDFFDQFIPYLQ